MGVQKHTCELGWGSKTFSVALNTMSKTSWMYQETDNLFLLSCWVGPADGCLATILEFLRMVPSREINKAERQRKISSLSTVARSTLAWSQYGLWSSITWQNFLLCLGQLKLDFCSLKLKSHWLIKNFSSMSFLFSDSFKKQRRKKQTSLNSGIGPLTAGAHLSYSSCLEHNFLMVLYLCGYHTFQLKSLSWDG